MTYLGVTLNSDTVYINMRASLSMTKAIDLAISH